MQIEPLVFGVEDLVDSLNVSTRAERHRSKHLRFSAGENRRSVHSREVTDFRPDVTHFVEGASVETPALIKNHVTHLALLDYADGLSDLSLRKALLGRIRTDESYFRVVLTEHLVHDGFFDITHAAVERRLVVGLAQMLPNSAREQAVHLLQESVRKRLELVLKGFDRSEGLHEFMLCPAELLDGLVGDVEGFEEILLGDFAHLAFDHDDGVLLTGDDQIEIALFGLFHGRIDDELTVETGNAHFCGRSVVGSAGKHEGGRGADAGEHVRVILLARRNDVCDDLRLVEESVRKERAYGAVDKA